MQYGDDVMEGTLAVCGDDDVWRYRLLPGQDALMLLHDRLRDEPGVLGFMSYDDGDAGKARDPGSTTASRRQSERRRRTPHGGVSTTSSSKTGSGAR